MDVMQKLAGEFPDVKFEHPPATKTSANMRIYDSRTYEGCLPRRHHRARHDQDQYPGRGRWCHPEVLRQLEQTSPWAQSVNPKIKDQVVWVNEWFSPPKETGAATSLINGGADVLFQNTDSPAVPQDRA